MRIAADKDIAFVNDAFSGLGELRLVEGRKLNRETVADADILLVRSITPVTAELIENTRVKFVASATSGREHIDLPYLYARGTGFAHAPGSNANSVAQYVVAAILQMVGLKKCRRRTLGIIGVGHVGSLVHAYAKTLGMKSILNDPPKRRKTGKNIYRPLKEVLEASDIITLHVPLERQGSDRTYHMVNADFLQQMKPGAVLINTSRGKVVDEPALKRNRKKLGGLAIDVWDNEPAIDPELCGMADIATPHIAGYSYDGKIKGTLMIHHAACSFLKRESFWNPEQLLAEPAGIIDVTKAHETVLSSVQSAFPVMRDVLSLRKTVLLNAGDRGIAFDALRSAYPKRYEFSHYGVSCSHAQGKSSEILKKLGFMVNESKFLEGIQNDSAENL
jgi:erythronate-4-phosphate dehydrogenase